MSGLGFWIVFALAWVPILLIAAAGNRPLDDEDC